MKMWSFFKGGVITKLDYFWGSFLYILGLFLKVKVQNWGLLNFNYFFGMPDIPDIFLGLTVVAGSKPTYQENISYALLSGGLISGQIYWQDKGFKIISLHSCSSSHIYNIQRLV